MSNPISIDTVQDALIEIQGQKVLLDSDVARIYGVSTKRINEAVRNNQEKFPEGYIIETSEEDLKILRSKISTTKLTKTRTLPKAFPERGLYMLATILKSKQATKATFSIIETFAQIRELKTNIHVLHKQPKSGKQQDLIAKSGQILSDILNENIPQQESETSVELNLAVVKFKHTIKNHQKADD